LMSLPVLVQRAEGSWVCHELLDLHRLLVDPHANRNLKQTRQIGAAKSGLSTCVVARQERSVGAPW
jgi:hypothetical protein